jgi:hypothetical protein
MASQFDESDFVDGDFQSTVKPTGHLAAASPHLSAVQARPPTRDELDSKVTQAQQQLTELKQAQDQLQRERAALEEARRRRIEFQTGHEEMIHHLTRGVGLLQDLEFSARREAEQLAKSLAELRGDLEKIQSIQEENWNAGNWNLELTRALTLIENARMEWNSARLKWPVLDGAPAGAPASITHSSSTVPLIEGKNFKELCLLGLAFSWPLLLVAVIGFAAVIILLLKP